MLNVVKKIFKTAHDRTMKRIRPTIEAINAFEPEMQSLTDAGLKSKTAQFREKLDNGTGLWVDLPPGRPASPSPARCSSRWSGWSA